MLVLNKVAPLTSALLFGPDSEAPLGTRIQIAASKPGQSTVFLNGTLCDLTPPNQQAQTPTWRFVVDDDSIMKMVRQGFTTPSYAWLEFTRAEYIVALGDGVRLHATESDAQELGNIIQLNVAQRNSD